MNKQAVRLNINAEELALCKPESVQAMDLAIRKVLSEIDQAKAQKQAADQEVTPENLARAGVGPSGIVTIMNLHAAGISPHDPRSIRAIMLAALVDAAAARKPDACALATEDEDEDEQPAGETFRF